MGKIRILDDHTANKIAAGEVVERPASVVKELVENSLDAGSTRIEIHLTGGGLDSIRVTDNGEGMTREDAVLAFSRHATSKISVETDLDHISTLGFRGEALPSIAAVATVEIKSRPREEVTGTQVLVKNGQVLDTKETGCSAGTSITVTGLFANVPARLKSIKSPSLETGHISDIVNRLAIAYPEVSFSLISEKKVLLQTTGKGDLLSIIAAIYGTETARSLIYVEGESSGITVRGYIGKPSVTRASRNAQVFMINNRVVWSRHISQALERGYHSLIMTGRRPLAFLNFTVPFDLVDPNVHPAKSEVRLYVLDKIVQLTEERVRASLSTNNLIPAVLSSAVSEAEYEIEVEAPVVIEKSVQQEFELEVRELPNLWQTNKESKPISAQQNIASAESQLVEESQFIEESYIQQDIGRDNRKDTESKQLFPDLTPLCQIDNTYIVARGMGGGLYLIDQHAAHERILYEKNMQAEGESYTQLLAVPEHIDMTHLESKILIENILEFHRAGFVVEHFGGDSFLLRGVPRGFPPGTEKKIFLDLLDYFYQNLHKLSNKQLHEGLLIMMSCKAAIKAGERLTLGQMEALLLDLGLTELPYTCPHGRPTTIFFSGYELEKMFKRVT